MRWDAYICAPDPYALAAEFVDHETTFSAPLKDKHDGLRGFEVTDPDGYVLFSAAQDRPRPNHQNGAVHAPEARAIYLPGRGISLVGLFHFEVD
jgi:hypothetical protein